MVSPPLIIHGLASVPASLRGAVVAVGDFDGVHLAHQAVLATLMREADERRLPAVVVAGSETAPPITPLPELLRLLGALGAPTVVLEEGAASPSGVIADRLARWIAPAAVLGSSGHDAAEPASSQIRSALEEGDVAAAAGLLGYRWFVRGEVVHGDKRGRELGYPTANIAVPGPTSLRYGIYAVQVRRRGGPALEGVASFGVRPTFGGGAAVLEVFIFDFAGDLYGETIEVAFLSWIRPELRFDGTEPLIARMREDEAEARRLLAAAGQGTALDRRLAATNL